MKRLLVGLLVALFVGAAQAQSSGIPPSGLQTGLPIAGCGNGRVVISDASGNLACDSGLTFDGTTDALTAAGSVITATPSASSNTTVVPTTAWVRTNGYTATAVQTTTSGTSIDFTGIPTWAKRIDISLAGVSGNGTATMTIQLGDAGGIEATGYVGASGAITGGVVGQNTISTGFVVNTTSAASAVRHGTLTLTLVDPATFTWVGAGTFSNSGTAELAFVAGTKSTSQALDRVRITFDGVDTFDAGKATVFYQ